MLEAPFRFFYVDVAFGCEGSLKAVRVLPDQMIFSGDFGEIVSVLFVLAGEHIEVLVKNLVLLSEPIVLIFQVLTIPGLSILPRISDILLMRILCSAGAFLQMLDSFLQPLDFALQVLVFFLNFLKRVGVGRVSHWHQIPFIIFHI